ncbi:MAG TPA: shikimate dehydrogenase [Vitreimonas sp.]|uniref:shikimate dehydrogenase n=1 Tax=Vitreimonas sp. TaxID=3069702 RepID=UPI002D4317F7|nr:shikimate dehydrogenase [Vitreimonas sp.]HYD89580.1 shikimate dehydrogenase [Vitreimonas sp.]
MTITAATKVFAVIGDPVSHSLSPLMHNGWFGDHGIDAVYVALPLRAADPVAAIRAIKGFGFSGLNVTVPYKETAAQAADRAGVAVANVLRRDEDGLLSAFNTDGQGFIDALSEAAPDWRARVKRVLIVGAGGAAVGIGHALAPFVDTIHFANRTHARGEAAAAGLSNGRVLRWEDMERGFGAADLIVQTTTLGMEGQPEHDWPVALCRPTAIVADIVYRPLETALLRGARARGLVAMDGIGMLIHQGARAFELWFGVRPDPAKARARLTAALA